MLKKAAHLDREGIDGVWEESENEKKKRKKKNCETSKEKVADRAKMNWHGAGRESFQEPSVSLVSPF